MSSGWPNLNSSHHPPSAASHNYDRQPATNSAGNMSRVTSSRATGLSKNDYTSTSDGEDSKSGDSGSGGGCHPPPPTTILTPLTSSSGGEGDEIKPPTSTETNFWVTSIPIELSLSSSCGGGGGGVTLIPQNWNFSPETSSCSSNTSKVNFHANTSTSGGGGGGNKSQPITLNERSSHHLEQSIHISGGLTDEDDEFGEDTEHIDFSALKGHLGVFKPNSEVDISDNRKGKYVFYSLQTGLLRDHVLADVCKNIGPSIRNLSEVMRSGPFWLDICDPSREELRALSEIFKMHPLTLEGLESEGEEIREKCDVFEKYYFVCIKAFESDSRSDDYMLPINLYMLVSPSCVVTIHRDPLEFSHTIAKRMRLLTARIGLASDWIVYTILEDVLEMFVPSVRSIELEIDTIDDLVGGVTHPKSHPTSNSNSQTQTELLGRIASARKRVTQLIRLMSAKSELLRLIAKRCSMRFSEDAHLYLRDLQDHTATVDQKLHHYDESLNRSHANYLAHISIEISETSNRMSDVMKKLTAASTVTLPWSMITGLMGMNIFVPGGRSYFTESITPWLFLFIVMASASIIIYCVGRRRDWF